MTITEYEEEVIKLLKSGEATEEMWAEVANAVSAMSDVEVKEVIEIDCYIEPTDKCNECGIQIGKREWILNDWVCNNCLEE